MAGAHLRAARAPQSLPGPGRIAPTAGVVRTTRISILIPLGGYRIHFATGGRWCGYERLVGPDTTYHRVEKLFDFRDADTHMLGFAITLYRVPGGNLPVTDIPRQEF